MSLTHQTAVRNSLANVIASAVDAGTINPNGQLIIMGAGDVALATLNLSNPAFGAASNGTITANAISSDTNADATGTAVAFKMVDRDGNEVYRGSVGTSGADLNLSSTSITAGDTVSVTSLTYTASA